MTVFINDLALIKDKGYLKKKTYKYRPLAWVLNRKVNCYALKGTTSFGDRSFIKYEICFVCFIQYLLITLHLKVSGSFFLGITKSFSGTFEIAKMTQSLERIRMSQLARFKITESLPPLSQVGSADVAKREYCVLSHPLVICQLHIHC